jgi:hypothetical protein
MSYPLLVSDATAFDTQKIVSYAGGGEGPSDFFSPSMGESLGGIEGNFDRVF